MYYMTLLTAFKAMLYVAKEEGLEDMLKEKYLELEEKVDQYEEIDVTDMIDNIENIYKAIVQTKHKYLEEDK